MHKSHTTDPTDDALAVAGHRTPVMYRLAVTLRDGTTHSADVAKMPRHWKSWLMQRVPYGTDFYGCTWSRDVIA